MQLLKRLWFNKKRPKILLVNPPYQRLRGMRSAELPLGIIYIATTLHKNGFDVKVLNLEEENPGEELKDGYVNAFESYSSYMENKENYAHPAWQEFSSYLADYQPDIVGFSVMTPIYTLALSMARFTKNACDALVVFGGPHPTLCPEEVALAGPVDVAMVGEGEEAFLTLATRFEPGQKKYLSKVPSAVFADNGNIVATPLQPLVPDLDRLPMPNYDLLVKPEPSALRDRFGVIVSRGCPYRCSFCVDNFMWRGQTRFRSLDNILSEIRMLADRHQLRNLFFQQDSFLNKPDLALGVANGIRDAGHDISWWCAARVDQICEETLPALKRSGLSSIVLGIESGSEKTLKSMNKKITIAQIKRAVASIKKHGIGCYAFFMIGLPDETEEDVRMTLSFMKELQLDFISLSVFTPLPRSPLFDRCVELGLITRQLDWDLFDYQSPENYFSAAISQPRFTHLLEEATHLVDELNAGT